MHNPEEQFKAEIAQVHLLKSEKEAIRQRVLTETPLSYPTQVYSSPFGLVLKFVAAPLALLLIIGGPITYAAQTSAPGDFLYQFELRVVEPVEESFYFGPAAQVDFHTSRLEERLNELKAMEGVDARGLESVTQNIEEHMRAFTASLTSSTESTEEKIRHLVKSKALVEAHEEVLKELASETEPLGAFGEAVEEELADTSEAYLLQVSEKEVEDTLTEAMADWGGMASSTDLSLRDSLQKQIFNITNAIEKGDLEKALNLSNDIQIKILKQQYLTNEEEL